MKDIELSKLLATKFQSLGGHAFFVGGCVRDFLMGVEPNDLDIEVYGLSNNSIVNILEECSLKFINVGKQFGVIKLIDHEIDIALPRLEKCIGKGHTDFEITTNENLSFKEACRRRDFTINAMMMDILTGEIVDPYHGQEDLKDKIIRHVNDDSFIEDPLRVYRLCQFAARFEFEVAPETISLASSMDISTLSKERIKEELKKALLKANKPSIFFDTLKLCQQIDVHFSIVHQLESIEQNPSYHPEGNVYIHTMQVLDRATKYQKESQNPYFFMLLALCHDLGKIKATKFIKGNWHAYNHENMADKLIEDLVSSFSTEKVAIKYLENMVPLHMKPNVCFRDNSSYKATNTMFYKAMDHHDLILFALCDNEKDNDKKIKFLNERYAHFLDMMKLPYVNGDDLTALGINGKEMKKYVDIATQRRMAEVSKKETLKEIKKMLEKNNSVDQ